MGRAAHRRRSCGGPGAAHHRRARLEDAHRTRAGSPLRSDHRLVVAWSIGHASNDECDDLGMSAAQRLAARRALDGLVIHIDHVLLDGSWDFVGGGIATPIVRGDQRSLSIAAASVVAKVTRDRILREAATRYPAYAFADNKGYPAPAHREALAAHGATDYHRRSWSFMDGLPGPMRAV